MPKPAPKPLSIVCTECGMPWEQHEKKELSECVRLLKAELARRPRMNPWAQSGTAVTYYPNVSNAQ